MADSSHSVLLKHRRLIISRILSIQFVAMIIVALTTSLTGISLFRESIYEKISSNTLTVAELVENHVSTHSIEDPKHSKEILSDEFVQNYVDNFGNVMNISIYIFDSDNRCLVCSENSGTSVSEVSVPYSVIKDIRNSSKPIYDDIHAAFNPKDKRPAITHGVHFFVEESDGSESEYFLFTNSYTNKVESYIRTILFVGCIVVIIFTVLFSIFIYKFTMRHHIDPQITFSSAIRRYAQGDYSKLLDLDKFDDSYYRENASVINQIVSNLKTSGEQQSQFISNVSHELRTPMTIISGYVNGILDGTVPKEKRTEYLYIVSQEMQRLKILVSSMLNLTKYDNGTIQINRELFPINDLVFKTLLMFENRLEKRNITVEGLDCDTVYVYGDNGLIGQVVYNLTENAVKFVNTGGTISVRMEETKDASVFAIRNTGPGIPKDELPKIFGRFYKSDFSRSQDKTGLGLGLDIIKKILRLHDAQISVSSEENVFTEFSVSFPKKPETND